MMGVIFELLTEADVCTAAGNTCSVGTDVSGTVQLYQSRKVFSLRQQPYASLL